jgi:eukaryotic-like serine/threonine-protein kinase
MTSGGAGEGPKSHTISSASVSSRPPVTRTLDDSDAAADGPLFEDRFDLVEELGRGGMGVVLVARDRRLFRTVAVKVLKSEPPPSEAAYERFLKEAQLGAQLEHPNIIPLYQLERTAAGDPAFAMKLIEGKTFSQYIADCRGVVMEREPSAGPFSLKTRIEHLLKVCDAMAYCHGRQVVHRDLKPANLMLGTYNEVYVMDWGLACVAGDAVLEGQVDGKAPPETVEESRDGRLTQHGQVLGTLPYMAPEQALGLIKDVGPAADQFSLGMILQELVTLHPARAHRRPDTLDSKIEAAQRGERRPVLHRFGAGISDSLEAIIDRATAVHPTARYPSVSAFADDLRRFVHGEEVSVQPDNLLQAMWRRLSRHPVRSLSVLVLLVAALGLIAAASLKQTLDVERASALERRAVSELESMVGRKVARIETRAALLTSLADALGEGTRVALEGPDPAQNGHWFSAEDVELGRAPSDFAVVERYGQPVSFLQPILVYSQGVDPSAVAPTLRRLAPIGFTLKDVLVRSGPKVLQESNGEDQLRLLREGVTDDKGSVFHTSFVATQNGIFVMYPGYGEFPEAFDARKRSWYREAVQDPAPHCGRPYPASTGEGLLIPCTRGVVDSTGAFLGMAGVEIRMAAAVQGLRMREVPGFRRAWIVDGEGFVVVDTENAAEPGTVGLFDNQAVERKAFSVTSVRSRMDADGFQGHVMEDDALFAYRRIPALDWFMVVEVDRKVYFEPVH